MKGVMIVVEAWNRWDGGNGDETLRSRVARTFTRADGVASSGRHGCDGWGAKSRSDPRLFQPAGRPAQQRRSREADDESHVMMIRSCQG